MSFAASLFASAGSNSLSSENHWIFGALPTRTKSGTYVTENEALKITAVYSAVGIIADACAQLPVGVYQKVGDRREERPEHPVALLLANPNRLMTAAVLRGTTQSHACLWGNGYQDIQRTGRGEPIALWPLLPDRTEPRRSIGDEREVRYVTRVDGSSVDIRPEDVLHIPALSFDGLRGYSPIQLCREGIGLTLALEQFGSSFFGNDAKSGGFLSHPATLSPEAYGRLRDSMQAQGGLDNAHRMKILEEGMTFHQTTIPPEDAQFLMTRTFQVEEIARMFRVPLHMLQSQSKTTSWGSGISQMSLGFVRFTLEPWLIRWEQELSRKLLTEEERAAGFYIKHNVNALLRADAEGRSQFYARALDKAKGWMSRNEVRALEDLNPDDVENEDPTPGIADEEEPEGTPQSPNEEIDDEDEDEEVPEK